MVRAKLKYAICVATLCATAGLAACGADDDGDRGAVAVTDQELLSLAGAAVAATVELDEPGARPAAAAHELAYADFAAAREQLGLDSGAALHTHGGEDAEAGFEEALLGSFAVRALPFVGRPGGATAVDSAIDTGRVERAVTVAGTSEAAAVALRTSQPFDEIATELEDAGFERADDGLLVPAGQPEGRIGAVGEGAQGVVLMAATAEAVRGALGAGEDPAELTPAAELVSELPGVLRRAGPTPAGAPCVELIAVGEDADPRQGELVLVLDAPAAPESVPLSGGSFDPGTGEIRFSEALAAGERVTLPFTTDDEINAIDLAGEPVYDC